MSDRVDARDAYASKNGGKNEKKKGGKKEKTHGNSGRWNAARTCQKFNLFYLKGHINVISMFL